jgi:plastocyanin
MAYPLMGLVFGAILVYSVSRVLLAVSEKAAPLIAMFLAINVLVGAALVAYGSRVRRRPTSLPLLFVATLVIVGVGLFARTLKPSAENAGPQVVALAAHNIAYDQSTLTFTAGAKIDLKFTNMDQGTPHSVAIFAGTDATGAVVYRGQIFPGPATRDYTFTAPAAGTYFFHCDVHPTRMMGTITVTAAGAAPGGGPPPPAGLALTAKNTAFEQKTLTFTGSGTVTVTFDNMDPAVPHNFAVFKGSDASAPVIFRGDLVTGPATKDYTFQAPPPGTYFFHCDVHPTQMTGQFIVK